MNAKQTKAEKKTRDAVGTRKRILEAAKLRFSRNSYEFVGMREIAADAGVDAAMVNRYFGSKEKLFKEVVSGAFRPKHGTFVNLMGFGDRVAQHFMSPAIYTSWEKGFDPMQLLLRAAVNPTTSRIVADEYHKEFVKPLAKLIKGKDAELRAAIIASHLLGFATMRIALNSPSFRAKDMDKVMAMISDAINHCLK